MMRCAVWLLVLLVCPTQAPAQEKKAPSKPLLETWQAGYYEGLKVGHVHTVAHKLDNNGKTIIRTTRSLDLLLKRYGSVIPLKGVWTCDENAAGKVLALTVSQSLAKDRLMTLSGVVKDGRLLFRRSPDAAPAKLPWNEDAVGHYYQETVYKRRKVKTGDRFKVVSYELELPAALTLNVVVKGEEAVDRLVTQKRGRDLEIVRAPVRLLRADAVPDKIKVGDQVVPLPTQRVWLDANLMPVRMQLDIPGLGPVTFYNTTKEAALKEGVAPELLPDLGLSVNIPLKETVDRPYHTLRAVYRITLTEPLDRVFVEDDRQKVRNRKGNSFELVVRARHEPGKDTGGDSPGKEYLASNHFIDSDNAGVKALAKKAVASETDAWKKARRVEKWVHDNMKVSTAVGFPTAARIAQDLEGDCRQHALLTAAMCRAAGVPSRTAIGLVYNRSEGRSPQFSFHMWTEVWVKGQWLGLDAVVGKVGATHLKMGEHSWDRTVTLGPLLPIASALGKVRIEVVSAR
jgi:transglutaminase-like putative cysteine protease